MLNECFATRLIQRVFSGMEYSPVLSFYRHARLEEDGIDTRIQRVFSGMEYSPPVLSFF